MQGVSRAEIRRLLVLNRSKHWQMLHRDLIAMVETGFREHLQARRREQRRAELRVPRRARRQWRKEQQDERRRSENFVVRELVDYLRLVIDRRMDALRGMYARNAEFRKAVGRVVSHEDLVRLMLDYSQELGTSRLGIWGDQRAARRWMKDDALNDRYLQIVGRVELEIVFMLDRLGVISGRIIAMVDPAGLRSVWRRLGFDPLFRDLLEYPGDARVHIATFECLRDSLEGLPSNGAAQVISIDLQAAVQRAATEYRGDVWLQCAAIDAMRKLAFDLFEQSIIQRLASPQEGDDLFVRRHCVRRASDPESILRENSRVWDLLLHDPSDAVRQQVVASLWDIPTKVGFSRIRRAAEDPVPQVRAMAMYASLSHLDCLDRHVAFLQLLHDRLGDETELFAIRVLLQVSSSWIHAWHEELNGNSEVGIDALDGDIRQLYLNSIVPQIEEICESFDDTRARRWAAASLESIWLALDDSCRKLATGLKPMLADARPGRPVRLPAAVFRDYSPYQLGRTIAVLTQNDYGYEITRNIWGYKIWREPSFGFRCWRAYYEFFRPATDKRQGHRHTVGRLKRGRLRVPSRVLGELSQTKVPGEPLVIGNEGSWRPFLPLPDDFVSTLNHSWIRNDWTEIYSSEGVTRIRAPQGLLRRIVAAVRLALRLPKIADLRNWTEDASLEASAYVRAMMDLGFEVTFEAHSNEWHLATQVQADDSLESPNDDLDYQDAVAPSVEGQGSRIDDSMSSAAASTAIVVEDAEPIAKPHSRRDLSVSQFFPAIALLVVHPWLAPVWNSVEDYAYYFGSAFENTLDELVLFTLAAFTFFLMYHVLRNLRIGISRRAIPISIGGWGTRGKSGTERLKAALFSATGHGLVSKTTGCEAMFIHAPPMGDPLEIPLYRPGDKATIWEQSNLLRTARKLKPSVFLWECMALSPDYVDVLQRQWMQDDLATVTNTYPDHEDLQGPSGYDVATTISGFVPVKSHVLSTEGQMLPLLKAACERVGSTFRPVDWVASGMITTDLLDRFSYQEHPDNIALVAAMADEFDLDFDYAVKAMADYLVADLGVLKTHPAAQIQGVDIELTNGMSANERFGALGNWSRLGFDRQDADEDPSVWISTVINNRADRVARSRVFASIVVNDLQVDRHFLIGSNLKGLQGFIWESWDKYVAKESLLEGRNWCREDAQRRLDELAKRFRVPTSLAAIRVRLRAMVEEIVAQNDSTQIEEQLELVTEDPTTLEAVLGEWGVENRVEVFATHHAAWVEDWQAYESLSQKIQTSSDGATLDTQLRQTLRSWFERKLVVIENYDATGDEVIQHIVDATPVGYLNRVMGMQNIKGTGLDFIYRFHAWDTCFQGCELLLRSDQASRQAGLNLLESMPEFGILCRQKISETLDSLRSLVPPLSTDMLLQVENIEKRFRAVEESNQTTEQSSARGSWVNHPWVAPLVNAAEQWMEVQDALRRRRTADLIYLDLQHARIGRNRAVQELRKLNKRQKGGWLAAKLS